MYYNVVNAKYLGDYTLKLAFEDGKKGKIDLKDYANQGGVFSKLADLKYFKRVYVNKEAGTICWPNGADIAPERLYEIGSLIEIGEKSVSARF